MSVILEKCGYFFECFFIENTTKFHRTLKVNVGFPSLPPL
ncbi:hypothetical protein HMPREF9996_00396 [Aggregatibacter actinomycetemcomitans Y4]|nr:hypothetical protein HMPREF9996_00396 [Aggregatibacter actinomycetemcomitans Y4]